MNKWKVFKGLVFSAMALPYVLRTMGLHPPTKPLPKQVEGGRVLMITTSQEVFPHNGKATGVFASELTSPYYHFVEAGFEVVIASIKGGKVPFEPFSLHYPIASSYDRRYKTDPILKEKVNNSLAIDEVNLEEMDMIFLPGGWGAAYDLGQSETLGEIITRAYERDMIIGAVCHGPLGLIQGKKPNGDLIVNNLRVTGVSDKQVKELGVSKTPLHPETVLSELGARYEKESKWLDVFANHVVEDGRIITGQNQNAGGLVANKMIKAFTRG